jgi:hypothetical protein
MKSLEQRIEEVLARAEPSQRAFQERMVREGEPRRQKLLARKRAFAHPDAYLSYAIQLVKDAQWRKVPVAVQHKSPDGSWTTATLKWVKKGTFLFKKGERARWGNGAEIAEDIAQFLQYGILPLSSGPSWY